MARRAHEYLPKKLRRPQAVRWHVGASDKATIHGIVCKCIKSDREGYIFQSIKDRSVHFAYTLEEYEALLSGQDFDLEPDGLSAEKAAAKLKAGVSSISELAASQQMVVDLREIAVWKFQELFATGQTSKYRKTAKVTIKSDIQPYVDAEARKSARSGLVSTIILPGAKEFLGWVKDYDRLGKLALVAGHHRCGNRKERYIGEVYALTMKHVYRFLSPERPTRQLLYKDLKAEIGDLNDVRRANNQPDLKLPDIDYFNQQINSLGPFEVDAARHLDDHAKRRFHPSKGGVPDLFRPMQRVEVDDWEVHLHTLAIDSGLWAYISPELQVEAEKTRCFLSAAICCVTRVLPAVVLSFEPNSANTEMLLRMCMSDKTALAQSIGCETPYEYRGSMFTLGGDEGSAILNARMQSKCDAIGIEFQSPQIETPQQRAKVERIFQTFEIRSLLRFSGRAFSNPTVRGKYEAQARACVTVDELAALILRFIVDEYHNTPHAGLDGATPRFRWLQLSKKFSPRSVPGKPLMRRALGEHYKIKLQPEGIEIFGNWYTSPAVERLYRDRMERDYVVIVDGEDLGGVSLRVDGGTLNVPGPDCMNGVTATVWDAALASMRRENKHVEKLVEPVVRRAIGFAQRADTETRKRLGIRYRPKSLEQLAKLNDSMGVAVRFAADPNPRPSGPVDILAGGIAVGTKAPPRSGGARPAAPAVKATPARTPKPKKPHLAATLARPKPQAAPRKPARPWKPKERR
jgi:putative transposase